MLFSVLIEGSDIFVGWVDEEGTGHIRDYWADVHSVPTLDSATSYVLQIAVLERLNVFSHFCTFFGLSIYSSPAVYPFIA